MKLINDIANFNKSTQIDILDLNQYQGLLDKFLSKVSESSLPIKAFNEMKSFIINFSNSKANEKEELERIHYEIFLKWLTYYQKKSSDNKQIGLQIVDFFTDIVSLDKLNSYDQILENSVLKQLLTNYETMHLFQPLIKKGLIIQDVEGMNPYYFNLAHGFSGNNMISEFLLQNNTPIPDDAWRYVFKKHLDGDFVHNVNYLLTIDKKDFIFNKKTKESVWHEILKTKKYYLIKFFSQDFYKPYRLKDKNLIEHILNNNDALFATRIDNNILKLVDNEKELFPYWDKLLLSTTNSKILINHYYQLFSMLILKIKDNSTEIKQIKKDLKKIHTKKNNHHLFCLLKKITKHLNTDKSINSDIIEYENYKHASDLTNLLFTENMSENLIDYTFTYLETLPVFDSDLHHNKKQIKLTENAYTKDFEYLISGPLKKVEVNEKLLSHFQLYFEQISTEVKSEFFNTINSINSEAINFKNTLLVDDDEKLKDKLKEFINNNVNSDDALDSFTAILLDEIHIIEEEEEKKEQETINNTENTSVETKSDTDTLSNEDEPSSENSTKEENENSKDDDTEEKIFLFTDEAFTKFKKEYSHGSNDFAKDLIKKLNKGELSQFKTLAKASTLLEQLDQLYTTFPHFEEVIKHIENLMVLQSKGDQSFFIPPLLLGGGPGVGKTFFCHTISKLVNTRFEMLNMESVTANFVLTGGSSQWNSSEPGKIFSTLFNEDNHTLNPIILLDELEKAGGDSRYNVMNSLLPLLERYTAKKFKSECIPLEIDASYIVWLATANDLDKLTAPIKSRFDIFSVPNPTPAQRKSLIKGIYSSVRANNSWGNYFDETLPEDSLDILSNLMAPGAARDLRKSITMACSKAIRDDSNIILPSHIERYDNGEKMIWDITN